MTYEDFGIDIPYGRTGGEVSTTCPACRGSRGHPNAKSLRVNLDKGVWMCHHCGWKGGLKGANSTDVPLSRVSSVMPLRTTYKRPKPKTDEELSTMSAKAEAWFASRGISHNTLRALKVSEGMEFMPQKGRECNTVQFNYFLNGELINTKFRTGDKMFKLSAGAQLIPYNIDAIRGEEECIITEGEMDALSFYEIGFHNVVSVPNGANTNLSYLDEFLEGYFDDKKVIYIASDTDSKGVGLRDELLRRFGPERCRVLSYGEGCKDANEHLMRYGAESLKQCLADAPETKVNGVITAEEYFAELDALYETGLRQGAVIGHPNFDELCSFETRRLCIVTGIPSSGKSEFIDEIAVRLCLRYGWRFAFFTPENMPLSTHIAKLISKIIGKDCSPATRVTTDYAQAKEFVNNNFFYIDPPEDYKLSTILEKAASLVRMRGIHGLVIDPYNYIDDESNGQNESRYISKQLDEMSKFAKRHDLLLILMAHPTKMGKDANGNIEVPTLYNISGSAHFYNKADFGIVVNRNKQQGCTEVIVAKVRFRHLGHSGTATFRYNLVNGRYVPVWDLSEQTKWDNRNYLNGDIDAQPMASNAPQRRRDNSDDWPFDREDDNDCPF